MRFGDAAAHTDQPPQIYDGYQSVSAATAGFRQAADLPALHPLNRAGCLAVSTATAQKRCDRLLAVYRYIHAGYRAFIRHFSAGYCASNKEKLQHDNNDPQI